jgi:hypothetical protein
MELYVVDGNEPGLVGRLIGLIGLSMDLKREEEWRADRPKLCLSRNRAKDRDE